MINLTNRHNASNSVVHNIHSNLHDTTSGDYIVLGDKKQIKFGAWYCENLSHALAIQKANGDGQTTLSNAENLPVVMCKNFKLKNVVEEKHAEGCDNIRIVAEYNNHNDRYNALQAANAVNAKHYYLFNSLTLEFIKCNVPSDHIDYLVSLIEYAPKIELNKLALRLAFTLALLIPSKYTATSAVEFIKNVLLSRGIDFKNTAEKIINKSLARRTAFIKKLNQVTDNNGSIRHNCDGLTNQQISILIDFESLKNGGTVFVDTRGMGAGKTNLMALRIGQLNSCAYLTHRVALIDDACRRLKLIHYKEGDKYADKIAICINSLRQFAIAVRGKPLFIDEARQVYDTIINSPTIVERQQLLECFIDILESAPIVYLADAGMSDEALAFYSRHTGGKQLNLIETTTTKSDVNHWHLDSLDACRYTLLKDLNHGKRGLVGCTSENEAKKTRKFLIKNGIKQKRILLVTGNNKGDKEVAEFLANVNEAGKKYDVIIHTSVLGSGVSIEIPAFNFTYLLCSNVLGSNESMQMLARNRYAKDVYIGFGNQLNINRVTDINVFKLGQIEKVKNFADKAGVHFSDDTTFMFNELDEMIHTSLAHLNQDLNDFANNFLLLAELEGRHFMKLENKVQKIKGLSKEVKQDIVNEIQSAPIIDSVEYNALKKSNATTSEQTASIKRYEVSQMIGMPNSKSIAVEDIKSYLNGDMSVLSNFQLLGMDTKILKTIDAENYEKRNKPKSLVSRQKIFKEFLKILEKAQIHGGITKPDLLKASDVLKKHHAELASEFGNYQDIKAIRIGKTVGYFANKFGYQLVNVGRESRGERNRIYEIKPIAHIERYALNQKQLTI